MTVQAFMSKYPITFDMLMESLVVLNKYNFFVFG